MTVEWWWRWLSGSLVAVVWWSCGGQVAMGVAWQIWLSGGGDGGGGGGGGGVALAMAVEWRWIGGHMVKWRWRWWW
jgi:hypothetical protein